MRLKYFAVKGPCSPRLEFALAGSWLCYVVPTALWILAAVLIAVLVTREQRAEQLSNSYSHG